VRILVAHNVGRDRNGGMSRIMGFIHDEVEAAGHQVEWLSAEDVPPRWRGAASRFAFPWLVWHRARSEAKAGRPYDLVNVHEPQGALVALDARRVTRHGVVVTSHGIEARAWELALEESRLGRGGPRLKTRLVYPITSLSQSRVALTRARFVFTLNDTDREYVIDRMRVAPDRARRMQPGASPSYAVPARTRTYESARHLVFAGAWRKNKGIEDLVPAFTSLARGASELTLTVLGAGVEPRAVLDAFPSDVCSRVSVVTSADEPTAIAELARADVFVLPSLFEGTPLTLIEGMASGLPIVTTDTCGMHDVIQHEVTGLLVPTRSPEAIAHAVGRLLESSALRARLGRAANAVAERDYTWPRVASGVLETYQRLTSQVPV
jgi:glycosyltransferase involved in cell wall biosynthesis